jgi:hypothetical protein
MIGYHGSQRTRLEDLEWMLEHLNRLRKLLGVHLVVKRSRTLGGAPDERLDLVKKTLEARGVCVFFAKNEKQSTTSEELDDPESESEIEDETHVVQ